MQRVDENHKAEDFRRYRRAAREYLGNLLLGSMFVGTTAIGFYIVWWFINIVDAWVKPFLPAAFGQYLPEATPAVGLAIALILLPRIGAAGARLVRDVTISAETNTMSPRLWALRDAVRKRTGANRADP